LPKRGSVMDRKWMPSRRRGERNIFCPHYGDCLDYAVKRAWVQWSCLQCMGRFDREPLEEEAFTSQETVCYYDIHLEGHGEP